MKSSHELRGLRGCAVVAVLVSVLALGGCDLGEFSSTATVTVGGREVASYLVRSAIMPPLQNFIDNAIDNLFGDQEEDD